MTAAACVPDEKLPCHPVIAPGMPLVFVIRNCEAVCNVTALTKQSKRQFYHANNYTVFGISAALKIEDYLEMLEFS